MRVAAKQVNGGMENLFQKLLQCRHKEDFRRHINKNVNVAIVATVATRNRPEQTEPRNSKLFLNSRKVISDNFYIFLIGIHCQCFTQVNSAKLQILSGNAKCLRAIFRNFCKMSVKTWERRRPAVGLRDAKRLPHQVPNELCLLVIPVVEQVDGVAVGGGNEAVPGNDAVKHVAEDSAPYRSQALRGQEKDNLRIIVNDIAHELAQKIVRRQ